MSIVIILAFIEQETTLLLQAINEKSVAEQRNLSAYLQQMIIELHLRGVEKDEIGERNPDQVNTAAATAAAISNAGLQAQLTFLIKEGYSENLRWRLGLPSTPLAAETDPATFTDEWVLNLFNGSIFGTAIDGDPTQLRQKLSRGLTHQVCGLWTGHTLYTILLRAGFIVDGPSGLPGKPLTQAGRLFLQQQQAPYPI